MRVRRCELRDLDSRVTPQWQGIALEAISDTGARMGTVAAKVDGSVAVIFERWVTGEGEVVTRLVHDLIRHLRTACGIMELRAGVSSDALSMRRSHIGWDLVIDAIQWAGAHGLPSYLHTQADNLPAQALYERLGYQPVDQVRILHRVFEDR